MFKLLIDMVDNALSVVTGPFFGEIPTQRQVSKLIADGISVVAISEMFGVGVEIIEGLLETPNAD